MKAIFELGNAGSSSQVDIISGYSGRTYAFSNGRDGNGSRYVFDGTTEDYLFVMRDLLRARRVIPTYVIPIETPKADPVTIIKEVPVDGPKCPRCSTTLATIPGYEPGASPEEVCPCCQRDALKALQSVKEEPPVAPQVAQRKGAKKGSRAHQ